MPRTVISRASLMVAVAVFSAVFVSCGGDSGSPMTPPPPDPPAPNLLPTASFTLSAEEGSTPLAVTFDASASSDPDGTLVSYAWAFGDGGTGTGQQTSHTFTDVGLFQVELTVRDDRSGEASTKDSVFVASPPGTGSNTIEGLVWFDRDLDGTPEGGKGGGGCCMRGRALQPAQQEAQPVVLQEVQAGREAGVPVRLPPRAARMLVRRSHHRLHPP